MNVPRFGLKLVSLLAVAVSWGASAAPVALDKALAARFEGDRTGACVVALRMDGGRVEKARYCAANHQGKPPALDAAFEIGSVTKTMTAFLVVDLIASGKWSLDDPIAVHLPPGTPEPRQAERRILVRDLVTHTSGLPVLPPGYVPAAADDPYASLSEADLLASLGHVKLTRPIGSQVEYSNFGMMVLSVAVSRAYGSSLEAALKARLFDPLGMKGAFVATPASGETVAIGHTERGTPTAAWTAAPNLAGVGFVKATLDDMQAYVAAELGDGPLSARMKATQQPVGHGFAMNWQRWSVDGHDLVGHEGATGGFTSFVALDPAMHRAVVILSDTALVDVGGLGDVGLPLMGVDRPVGTPRREIPVAAATRLALAGDFDLAGMKVRIHDEGGRLMAYPAGQAAFELHADDHGDLYPATFDALLSPVSIGGKVDRFVWRQGGGKMEGVRVRAQAAAAPASSMKLGADCEGNYRLTPQFSLRVFREAGQLKLQGTGQPAFDVAATAPDRVESTDVGVMLKFNRDAHGVVVGATLLQRGAELEAVKQ